MSLFQKSVVNKYLKTLDSSEVEKSFLKSKDFYGNSSSLENIRLLKEENYQEGLLREIPSMAKLLFWRKMADKFGIFRFGFAKINCSLTVVWLYKF